MIITPINWFCCIQLFFSFCLAAMEPLESSGMVKIKEWKDVNPFAGKAVAYTTSSTDFCCHQGFTLDEKSEIKYGIVLPWIYHWSAEQGYCLSQLHLAAHEDNNIGLTDSSLCNAQFTIRYAYDYEIITILEAMKNNKVCFDFLRSNDEEYNSWKCGVNLLQLLSTQSGFELQKKKIT